MSLAVTSILAQGQSGPLFLALLFLILGIVAVIYGVRTLRRVPTSATAPPVRETKFACPHCGQHIAATPEYSLRTVPCPTCTTPILIPAMPGADDRKPARPAPLTGSSLLKVWLLALAIIGLGLTTWLECGPYAVLARGFTGSAESYSRSLVFAGNFFLWIVIPLGLCAADPAISNPHWLAAVRKRLLIAGSLLAAVAAALAWLQIRTPNTPVAVEDFA